MITFSRLGRMGRFCNGAFSIAGTIGIAVRSGQQYGFPLWQNHDHKDRFGSTEDIDLYKHFVNPLPVINMQDYHWQEYPYYWGYRSVTFPHGNWDLQSHFQSDKYFNHCIDLIRHYFTMKDEPAPGQNTCAIHLRAGDYDNSYHPVMTGNYYAEAIKHIPEDSTLILFSDDVEKAQKVISQALPNRSFMVAGNDYITDFKMMKQCRHFITANSSYSLLAAILGNQPGKKIVCPKNWFGPAWGPGQNEVMTADIYPENAIVI